MGLHALGGVYIQGHLHAAAVQLLQQCGRVGEKLPVPGVACPAAAVLGVDVHQVPVHVDDPHGEGDVFLLEAVHQLQIAVLSIAVVTAPPVAQSKAGQHGGRAAQMVKVLKSLGIVVSIAPEVQVLDALFSGLQPAVLQQNLRGTVIQHGKAVAGENTALQRNGAVGLVQSAGGAAQVAGLLAVAPDAVVLGEAALHLNSQTLGRERLFVIYQVHAVGVNLQLSILVQHPKIGFGEIPVEDGLGGPVLKDSVGAVLQAQQALGEHRDAVVLPGDNVLWAGSGRGLDMVDGIQDRYPLIVFPLVIGYDRIVHILEVKVQRGSHPYSGAFCQRQYL